MASETTDAERFARLEERLEGIERVSLRLEAKLDAWQETYVPRTEINEMFRARDEQIHELKDDKKTHRANLPMWVSASAAVIALVAMFWPHGK